MKFIVKNILVEVLILYKKCISPLLGNHCRFYPTCSEYTRIAIEKYGVKKGVYKGIKRLLSCHPWNPGGVDFP